ncbi:EboA domain-containing protein [Streptomyces sp. Ac-502]|uniref:EboA domain-containing protein n=1 Tax=Streptomyces sp. Ac-502 TaxID=3342801 RepID=UPI0038625C37
MDEAQAEARATAQAAARAEAAVQAAAQPGARAEAQAATQPEGATQAAAQPGARAADPAASQGAAQPEGAVHPEAAAEAAAQAASVDPRGSAVSGAALSYTAYAPPVWEMRFASAGRHCTRREPPHARDREAAEAARILLLHTARADARTVTRLYEHGTAAERRAVLMALPHLDLGPSARPLVEDALRTDDTRLVAAAVGPYAARHLDAHTWRHAVLKCLFTGVPVTAVAGLAERARGDTELAHMLTAYARERTAAYRPVPADLQRVLDLTAPPASTAPLASPFPSDPAPALAPGPSPAPRSSRVPRPSPKPGRSPDPAPTVAPGPASSHAAHDASLQPPPVPPL